MASGKHPREVEMDSILECPVCLEYFCDPRVLPCQHTLCLKCLEQHVRASFNSVFRTFYCPECRKRHAIPRGGVEQFPTNFLMNKLKDIHQECGKGYKDDIEVDCSAEKSTKCSNSAEADEHEDAIAFCKDCMESFCTECRDWHVKFKATREHQLVEMEKAMAETPQENCPIHPRRKVSNFCITCSLAVCDLCPEFPEPHHSHDCLQLQVAAKEGKSDLTSCLESITKHLSRLEILPKAMTDLESKIKIDVFSAKQTVATSVEAACQLIQEQGEWITENLSTIEQEALAEGTQIQTQQRAQLRQFNNLKVKAEGLQNAQNDVELIKGVTRLKNQMQNILATPLPLMNWESVVIHPKTNGLKDALGKARKDQSTHSKSPKKDVPDPPSSQQQIRSANFRLLRTSSLMVTRKKVTGIAAAAGHIIMTHESNQNLWVYDNDGQFVKCIAVGDNVKCSGIAAMNAEEGRIVVSDSFFKQLHWLLVSTDAPFRILGKTTLDVQGQVWGLTADINNYAVLTTRLPFRVRVFESDPNSWSLASFAGNIPMNSVLDPSTALRTPRGFAVFSDRVQEIVYVDDYGRRESSCKLRIPQDNAYVTAKDMCLGYLPHPMIFIADRYLNYIHLINPDPEGKHFPCALNQEDHGISVPSRVCWDDSSKRLLVAQSKRNDIGSEIRIFSYRENKPQPVQKEEITSVALKLELPKQQ